MWQCGQSLFSVLLGIATPFFSVVSCSVNSKPIFWLFRNPYRLKVGEGVRRNERLLANRTIEMRGRKNYLRKCTAMPTPELSLCHFHKYLSFSKRGHFVIFKELLKELWGIFDPSGNGKATKNPTLITQKIAQ